MNDDVTVVITNFNYGAYLREAVDSALTQSGGPPHVVVVDDGSTDTATLQVLDALPDPVRVLRQANAGASAARNAGIAASATPYVLCLDADDRLAAGALERLRGALDEHLDAGFAYGDQRLFGAMDAVMRFPPYDPLRLLDRHLIGPTALMRRTMLDDIGGYDTAFALYEDWELWIDALAHGWRGVRVDAITHEYRRHAGSKLGVDRARYRSFRRQVRAKHAALYGRRRELARESDLSAAGRALYRWYWGPRPVPARVEAALYAAIFSSSRKAR
jgi:glycosyltransferase involved in cell wall biosynthesis